MNSIKRFFYYSIFSLLLAFAPATKAASFDCARANTSVEKAICSTETLGELDKALAELYAAEVERESESARVKTAQRNWLAKRNACTTNSCIEQSYELRLAEMYCDGKGIGSGSGYGAAQCSHYSLQLANRELIPLEQLWIASLLKDSNNANYLTETFNAENKAWRDYRRASCRLYGATEGGIDIWKTAFAIGCEHSETQKRIKRLKGELKQ
jgi:uncharacterized protein YecT (DUF1311 family)